MTVEIISKSISMKVWTRSEIKPTTPESAIRLSNNFAKNYNAMQFNMDWIYITDILSILKLKSLQNNWSFIYNLFVKLF